MGFFGTFGSLYPKVVSLNIEFQVLHEEPMGWSTKKTFRNNTFPFEG